MVSLWLLLALGPRHGGNILNFQQMFLLQLGCDRQTLVGALGGVKLQYDKC